MKPKPMIVTSGHRLFICRCVKDLGHCVYCPSYALSLTDTCKETLSEFDYISAKIGQFLSYIMARI